jgi:GxxExxY protein
MNNKDIILNCSKYVYDQLDYGLSETAYRDALKAELEEYYRDVQIEYHVCQYFKTSKGRIVQVADLRIDIFIDKKIIIELKTLGGKLTKKNPELMKSIKEYKQCHRYKQLKQVDEAYLINFGEKGLEFIEII